MQCRSEYAGLSHYVPGFVANQKKSQCCYAIQGVLRYQDIFE